MFTPELEPRRESNDDVAQITQHSQEQFFATVIKFLIDGNDTDAARLLFSSNLRISIDYQYGWIDELNDIIGWRNDGYVIQIECLRAEYDVLSNLLKPNKIGDVATIDRAFESILGHHEHFSYKVSYLMDPVDPSAWRTQFQELIAASSESEISNGILHGKATVNALPNKILNQIDYKTQEKAVSMESGNLESVVRENESRIFLSHKSENKERVLRYYNALKALGYNPWLDGPDMPAGTVLDRGVREGVAQSCGVVFFITEDFTDERILADEINYAKLRERDQGNLFSIITLRFSEQAEVPELLKPYVWKDINNDLDGLYEIVRALPIELGPAIWRISEGNAKSKTPNSVDYVEDLLSQRIQRNLTVVEKRDILHNAIAEIHSFFESALGELARSKLRIEYRIGHDTNAGFTCFISLDGELIKGSRIYIGAGFNGITYDGNTHSALRWEIDEINRQIDETKREINENLQAVYDGSAEAAALVRSLDAKTENLRSQLQKRTQLLDRRGHNLRFLEGDDSYKIVSTVALLDAQPVLEFLPSPSLPTSMPDSRICTFEEAARILSSVFIGDVGS